MIDRKGVRELIHAFQAIDHPDLGLILIGEGPEKARYMQATTGMTRIFWEGYLQTSQMGPYFACADVLVMPSYLEPWGLVVNEAMAAGLPVIATTCSGATTDLLQEGITGHAIAAGDVNRLVTLLYSVLQEPDRWRQMGRQAAVKIQEASPARYAADFAAACRLAVAPRPR
jgi:glycosyltransferase involved in cell wall biosynthesis